MVCGIFIVVLSLLLCFAWREAFFISKIVSWDIQNYDPKNNVESKDSLPRPSQVIDDSSSEISEARPDAPSRMSLSQSNSQSNFSAPRREPSASALGIENEFVSQNGEPGPNFEGISQIAHNEEPPSHQSELDIKKEDEIENQDSGYTRKDIRIKRQDSTAIEMDPRAAIRNSYDFNPGKKILETNSTEMMRIRGYSVSRAPGDIGKTRADDNDRSRWNESQVSRSLVLQLGTSYWKGTWGSAMENNDQEDAGDNMERNSEDKVTQRLKKIVGGPPIISTETGKVEEQRVMKQVSRLRTQTDQQSKESITYEEQPEFGVGRTSKFFQARFLLRENSKEDGGPGGQIDSLAVPK